MPLHTSVWAFTGAGIERAGYGDKGGGTEMVVEATESDPHAVPTQTSAPPRPRRDHPPLLPQLIEQLGSLRPPRGPQEACSRATLWCGLQLRGPWGFKITHQRWGGVQEEAQGRMRAGGQVCTHDHMFFFFFDVTVLFKRRVAFLLPGWKGESPLRMLQEIMTQVSFFFFF